MHDNVSEMSVVDVVVVVVLTKCSKLSVVAIITIVVLWATECANSELLIPVVVMEILKQ